MEGEQSEIVGGGCKLLRSRTNEQEWNGVGLTQSKELNENLISVSRKNGPVMSIDLGLDDVVVSIMCAYVPQVCCIENEKESFWEHVDQELSATQDGNT